MFGRGYFGGRFFGPRYYGDGSDTAPPGASAAQIWGYTLSNGLSAGQNLVLAVQLLRELHLIHGLTAGSPLTVAPTARTAGAIAQTIAEAAGIVTVTRDP